MSIAVAPSRIGCEMTAAATTSLVGCVRWQQRNARSRRIADGCAQSEWQPMRARELYRALGSQPPNPHPLAGGSEAAPHIDGIRMVQSTQQLVGQPASSADLSSDLSNSPRCFNERVVGHGGRVPITVDNDHCHGLPHGLLLIREPSDAGRNASKQAAPERELEREAPASAASERSRQACSGVLGHLLRCCWKQVALALRESSGA